MNKVRSNALWNELSPEQLERLDKWLFEENLSYTKILPKAQSELGFKGSESSLKRYYYRRKQEKKVEEIAETAEYVAAMSGAGSDVGSLRTANMKLLGTYLFQALSEGPERLKELTPTINLMLQNDHNEALRELRDKEEKLRRELKAEDHKIRREMMEFAKTKFQFDVTEQAMKALPELQELAQARKDPDTKRYEANAFLNMARRRVAGVVWEVKPESAQEEAEMLAARKAREERKQRRLEWEQREKITGHEPPTPSSPYYAEYLAWKEKRGKHDHGE
jgi:Protein of unknown function (DUF3486)